MVPRKSQPEFGDECCPECGRALLWTEVDGWTVQNHLYSERDIGRCPADASLERTDVAEWAAQ